MESKINFNLNPYYDDFDETKGFHRILFKPGYSVQARELTQLQTQIQNQITKFGNHIFKEGSVVTGGNFSTSNISYILVGRDNDISNFTDQVITGQTSGAQGKVVSTSEVSDLVAKIYYAPLNGIQFIQNEVVICTNTNTETIQDTSDFFGSAVEFSIDNSIFYVLGNFVYCENQSIIIAEDTLPTCVVGLDVTESIITSNNDTSLLDPALGSYNYSAPGADRYNISLSLAFYSYDPDAEYTESNLQENFVEITRFINGVLQKKDLSTQYSDIEKTLAKRTYDESGDYTVNPFKIKIIDNIYGNDDNLSIQVEAGKAYVKGYEFSTDTSTYIDLPKARTTKNENEFPVYINYGKYLYIEDISGGVLDYTNNQTANLKNSSGTVIGNCQVKYIEYDSQDVAKSAYKLFLDTVNTSDTIANVRFISSGAFTSNIASNLYSTGIQILGNDNPTYIVEIPKGNIHTIDSNETSYETLIKVPNNGSFSSNGSYAVATIDNTGPSNQIFIGTGSLSESDTRSLYHFVVATSSNTGVIPVDKVLDYSTHMLRVTVVDENTLTVSTNVSVNFTAAVFAKVSVSGATNKTKTVQDSTLTLSGATLTSSNLSSKISLSKADCIKVSSVIVNTATDSYDYTNNYVFNNGQTDVLYDHGYIKLKPGYNDPISAGLTVTSMVITFQYYSHTGTSSGFFNVNSYPDYDQIGTYTSSLGHSYDLKNCFDFRPRRDDGATTISGNLLGQPSSLMVTDFDYYLGRIDRLVITKDKTISLIQGIPADIPDIPTDLNDAMPIYTINVPPYTKNSTDVSTSYIENKRYTMRDIGKLERRIEKVEYYTSLSLLEKQASDESITDINSIERFKNGILVDSFAGHSVGDVNNTGYACSIDYNNKILRPPFSSDSFTFDTLSGSNYIKSGNILTANGGVEYFINQSLVSSSVNLNPYNVFIWDGLVDLNPSSDNWVDTTTTPDVTVNLNGENDVFTILTDTVENPVSTGVKWGDWATVVKGVTGVSSTSSTSAAATTYTSTAKTTEASTTTTSTTTISNTLSRIGVEISTGETQTITQSLGTKIVDVSIVPYIRSRNIKFFGSSLKPSTDLYATFDGINVSEYCFPATEIQLANTVNTTIDTITLTSNTAISGDIISIRDNRIFVNESNGIFQTSNTVNMVANGSIVTTNQITGINRSTSLITNSNGEIAGIFNIPNNSLLKFRTGERTFKLADVVSGNASTAASSKYIAQGLAQTLTETLLSTRVATTSINPTTDTKSVVTSTVAKTNVVTSTVTTPAVTCSHVENGGRVGNFQYTIDLGYNTGNCGISYNAYTIPDRYTIIWDGKTYSTGFVGSSSYNTKLNALGYPNVSGTGSGNLVFNKTKSEPATAILKVDAPITGTAWRYAVNCPGNAPITPTQNTTASRRLVIAPPETVSFDWGEFSTNKTTLQATIKLTVETTGVTSQYVRVSGLTASNGVTLSTNTIDFTTTASSLLPSRRTGTATITATVPRPSKDMSSYNMVISGTAIVYSDSGRTIPDSTLTTMESTSTSKVSRNDSLGRPISKDPVAQTFFVDGDEYPAGLFIHSVGLFFKSKDESLPVSIELRPTVNGYPSSSEIIPMSVVSLPSSAVETSTTGTTETRFYFQSPIYLAPGEYALVARCNSTDYEIYTAVLGDFLLTNTDIRVTEQPSAGSMFKSQNSSTWTPVQEEDIAFRLYKYYYNTGESNTASVILKCNNNNLGDREYDLLYADGESINFGDTSVKYSYKTTDTNYNFDTNWTDYQLGANIPMSSRKVIRKENLTDLQFKVDLRTDNRNITPIVDLERFSTVVVSNIVNNGTLSDSDFIITYQGAGYTQNANVSITSDTGSGAAASAVYANNALRVLVTNSGSGYTGNIAAIIDRSGSATANATVVVKNEIYTNLEGYFDAGNNKARYISRKVTLASGFESTDLILYLNAKLPSGTEVIPYYKVAAVGSADFNSQPWRKFELRSSDDPNESKFVEYSYKTPGDTAIPSGDRFQTFAIKLVMYSSDTTKVPQIKDLRVIALDE